MTLATLARPRFSFAAKALAALALAALADFFFFEHEPGWTLGAFALAWAAALALAVPATCRGTASRIALAAAAGFALILVEDPDPLAWLLFGTALSMAALLPRRRFDDALSWAGRLALHGLSGLLTPVRDAFRAERLWRRRGGPNLAGAASLLALPLAGGAIFLILFAIANPVIAETLGRIRLPDLGEALPHLIFWIVVLLIVWPSLRPHRLAVRLPGLAPERAAGPSLPLRTLLLSLVVFNLLFAVQNALDIAFLWSGAPLPRGVTLAEYAHRGAYTLIVTAILAGLFVLAALRPGSESAQSPLVRRLVALWVAQNLLLVASSAARLVDYVAVYSLTVLRIAALMWMLLVAAGLVLICWRLLAGRSARWLINANALAAALVLGIAAAVDLGATAAAWNVRHAREVDGTGAAVDLCYLNWLGDSALLPLIELEKRPLPPALRDRVAWVRAQAMTRLEAAQADWRQWTWRGARRLAAARAALGPNPARPAQAPRGRNCDGSVHTPPPPVFAPPPPAPAPTPPLTKGAER